MTRRLKFYVRNTIAIVFILAISIWLVAAAIIQSSAARNGILVLFIGFASGFIPIMAEAIIAWYNGTLFVRNKTEILDRRAWNMKLTRKTLGPAVGLGVTLAFFPKALQVFILASLAGYLLTYGIGLAIHFIRNHREIYKLTKDWPR